MRWRAQGVNAGWWRRGVIISHVKCLIFFPNRLHIYCTGEQGGHNHSWGCTKGSVATYRSRVLLSGIQGTSESFGGLGIFVLYPESTKLDDRQVNEKPESGEQELLNIYSGLLTTEHFISCRSATKSF